MKKQVNREDLQEVVDILKQLSGALVRHIRDDKIYTSAIDLAAAVIACAEEVQEVMKRHFPEHTTMYEVLLMSGTIQLTLEKFLKEIGDDRQRDQQKDQ